MSSLQNAFELKDQRKFGHAALIFQQLIQSGELKSGRSAESLKLRNYYGECLIEEEKYADAERYLQETLVSWQALGGTEGRKKAARTRAEVGLCVYKRCDQGKENGEDKQSLISELYRSQQLLRQSLQVLEVLPPIQHKRVFEALRILSEVNYNLMAMETRAMEMTDSQKLGEEIVSCYKKMLQHAEVLRFDEEAITGHRWRLAMSLIETCQEEQAQALLEEVLDFLQRRRKGGRPATSLDFDADDCIGYIEECSDKVALMKQSIERWPLKRHDHSRPPGVQQRWSRVLRTVIVDVRMNWILDEVRRVVRKDRGLLEECIGGFKLKGFPRAEHHLIQDIDLGSGRCSRHFSKHNMAEHLRHRTTESDVDRLSHASDGAVTDEEETENSQGALFVLEHTGRVDGSKKWLDEFKRFNKYLRQHISDPKPSIKVVILDSGIDPDHPFIKTKWNPCESGDFFRDFVGDPASPTKPCDNEGHGTHCAGVILQFAPDVTLYVARVVDTRESCAKDRELNRRVLQALKWAIEDVEANIVSMSFGLGAEDDTISELLEQNVSRTTCVAAAANSGSRQSVAYPASESNVFCIHSCKGSGRPSDFTPPPICRRKNFSILGEGILSAWPTNSCVPPDEVDKDKRHPGPWKYCSGTSVATPMAAALIANLKAYVSVKKSRLKRTLHHSKLNHLLTLMSTNVDGYDHLVPWRGQYDQFKNFTDGEAFYDEIERALGSNSAYTKSA